MVRRESDSEPDVPVVHAAAGVSAFDAFRPKPTGKPPDEPDPTKRLYDVKNVPFITEFSEGVIPFVVISRLLEKHMRCDPKTCDLWADVANELALWNISRDRQGERARIEAMTKTELLGAVGPLLTSELTRNR